MSIAQLDIFYQDRIVGHRLSMQDHSEFAIQLRTASPFTDPCGFPDLEADGNENSFATPIPHPLSHFPREIKSFNSRTPLPPYQNPRVNLAFSG